MKPILQARVLATLSRYSMLRPGDRVGVGVSGGGDSVALLDLLFKLRNRLGIGLVVLHFHHQLRGAAADEDEDFVRQLADRLNLECTADRADVPAEAARNGWNLEDAARRLRYDFFRRMAVAHNLDRVAVAQTADDQAETVLAHLLRGSGPTGLAGIYPVAGHIVRPLIELRRAELRAYLVRLGQPWREDASNQDTSRVRARIRHSLLPLLERDFEPAVVPRLARLADLAHDEELFWQLTENNAFSKLVAPSARSDPQPDARKDGKDHAKRRLRIAVSDLLAPLAAASPDLSEPPLRRVVPSVTSLALVRRLIRRIYFEFRGGRQQLTARHVESVIHLAARGQSGSRVELPGVIVERVFHNLFFSAAPAAEAHPPQARPFEYAIACPEPSRPVSVLVSELARRFDLKIVDCPRLASHTIHEGLIDLERLRWPLILRSCRPGDSYRPWRHRGLHKLSRLLLESRIPSYERADWPVLTSAGRIIWAPLCPIADDFAAPAGARAGLTILERAPEALHGAGGGRAESSAENALSQAEAGGSHRGHGS